MKKIFIGLCTAVLLILPVSVFANNYNYSDSWTTLEYRDTYNSGTRATYSTRYSARQANCEVIVRANGTFRTARGYQTAYVSFATYIDNSHGHEHSGY